MGVQSPSTVTTDAWTVCMEGVQRVAVSWVQTLFVK